MRPKLMVAAGALAMLAGPGAAEDGERLKRLGQHLSRECTTCHMLDGPKKGIPIIIGLDMDYFVKSVNSFKTGERTNPVMVSVASSLDDEQIKALAIYFSSLPKPMTPAGVSAEPAAGKKKK